MIITKDEELKILKENAKVHKIVFDNIKANLLPWINARDIDKLAWDICKEHDVLCWFKWVYDFPANLCMSVNDVAVHWLPSKKIVFKEWDVVTIDFWVKDKKIWINTDAAFTVIIWEGPHDPEIERFLRVNQEALMKWIAKAVVWNRVWDIWHAIQTHIESNWFHVVKDLTWHWLWYELHEKPYIYNYWKPWTWPILKANQLLAIEPIMWFSSWKISDRWWWEIYIADWSLWSQFEHTIIVKEWYPEIII